MQRGIALPGRRLVLAGLGAGGAALALGCRAEPPVSRAPLRAHAAARGMDFGLAVAADQLAQPDYARLVSTEADMIVGGNELKWTWTEPRQGAPDFSRVDALAAFAADHRLKLRGHTAFWWRGVPPWAKPALLDADGRRIALAHIADIVGRMRGRVVEWDVVNEVIEPKDGQPGGLRRLPFGRAPDPGFIAECFRVARAADPAARLYINEYGIECDTPEEEARRVALLALLGALKAQGAPVEGLGIQSHLATYRRFSAPPYRAFLREVAAMGLAIRLTEFDVVDTRVAGDIAARDAAVADYARAYLDTAFDETAVRGLVAWGVRDRDSWLQFAPWAKRADGQPLRPLPFDDRYRRTPLWTAIARAYDGAPAR